MTDWLASSFVAWSERGGVDGATGFWCFHTQPLILNACFGENWLTLKDP